MQEICLNSLIMLLRLCIKLFLKYWCNYRLRAATSRLLASQNKIIVYYYSSKDAAEKVAKDIEESGAEAFLIQDDLTSEEACKRSVERLLIDILNLMF